MGQNKIYVYAGWEDNKKIGTIFSDMLNGIEVVSFAFVSIPIKISSLFGKW
ncbi:MAG: hypothetical protein K6G27_10170 [Lachnospiraceae bacterium]|nr:hypothetical protein [Lachnospiraceae bacterium]